MMRRVHNWDGWHSAHDEFAAALVGTLTIVGAGVLGRVSN